MISIADICYTHSYELIDWHTEVLTQLPYALHITMPNTDRGKRGYSNKLVAQVRNNLFTINQ